MGDQKRLEDEQARQQELRRQAELSRMGRGRKLASVVGDEFFASSTILGNGPHQKLEPFTDIMGVHRSGGS